MTLYGPASEVSHTAKYFQNEPLAARLTSFLPLRQVGFPPWRCSNPRSWAKELRANWGLRNRSNCERRMIQTSTKLQKGANATSLFAKPQSIDGFLAAYSRVPKDDIRPANIGEKLGFLGGIIHGSNPSVGRRS